MPKYRPNVAALILNEDGELLVCERLKNASAWQFPQGGVDKGESDLDALKREVWEEVGLKETHYTVLEQKSGYCYLYPPSVKKKKNWDGQRQTYFLCQLNAGSPEPNLGDNNPEFSDYDWVKPQEFDEAWLPKFKRSVYRRVMFDFFGVELAPAS